MRVLVALAIGGALGTVGRYSVGLWSFRILGPRFAFGTLFVNVAGCFLLGFLMHVAMSTETMSRSVRLAATTGFLGAFTTFSTFGYETVRYIESGSPGLALTNVFANLGLGFVAVWAGLYVARAILATV